MTIEEHISGLKGIKPFMQKQMLQINYEGLGELDAREVGETIDVAIEALEMQAKLKRWINGYKLAKPMILGNDDLISILKEFEVE